MKGKEKGWIDEIKGGGEDGWNTYKEEERMDGRKGKRIRWIHSFTQPSFLQVNLTESLRMD